MIKTNNNIWILYYLPDEGGVDFRELGTTSPKLDDEFAPSLLKWDGDTVQRSELMLNEDVDVVQMKGRGN